MFLSIWSSNTQSMALKHLKKAWIQLLLNSKGLIPPVIFFLGAKSALLIDCYFNETSWYQLRKDIFIRYDWADSHVESIWCKTWTHPVLRYPSKYFLWNRKITKELVIKKRGKKELKKHTHTRMTCSRLSSPRSYMGGTVGLWECDCQRNCRKGETWSWAMGALFCSHGGLSHGQ